MGNYKFRLSDMLPNAWFYKLRDMSKPRNNTQTPNSISHHHRHHHHPNFNNKFDPPRRSLKNKWARRRTAVYVPSDPRKINPDAHDHDVQSLNLDKSFLSESGNVENPSTTDDIIFNVDHHPILPPILTRPKTPNSRPPDLENDAKIKSCGSMVKKLADDDDGDQKKTRSSPGRVSLSRAGRVRINRKRRKRHLKELVKKKDGVEEEAVRFAIVKSSLDPEKDFRESMMEMIVEKKMKESKELEDLLACYLSLNSDQYHDVIIRAFQHIWFNLDP